MEQDNSPRARNSRCRRKRREAGLCGYEGCRVLTGAGAYYCDEHRARDRVLHKMRRLQAMIASGRTE